LYETSYGNFEIRKVTHKKIFYEKFDKTTIFTPCTIICPLKYTKNDNLSTQYLCYKDFPVKFLKQKTYDGTFIYVIAKTTNQVKNSELNKYVQTLCKHTSNVIFINVQILEDGYIYIQNINEEFPYLDFLDYDGIIIKTNFYTRFNIFFPIDINFLMHMICTSLYKHNLLKNTTNLNVNTTYINPSIVELIVNYKFVKFTVLIHTVGNRRNQTHYSYADIDGIKYYQDCNLVREYIETLIEYYTEIYTISSKKYYNLFPNSIFYGLYLIYLEEGFAMSIIQQPPGAPRYVTTNGQPRCPRIINARDFNNRINRSGYKFYLVEKNGDLLTMIDNHHKYQTGNHIIMVEEGYQPLKAVTKKINFTDEIMFKQTKSLTKKIFQSDNQVNNTRTILNQGMFGTITTINSFLQISFPMKRLGVKNGSAIEALMLATNKKFDINKLNFNLCAQEHKTSDIESIRKKFYDEYPYYVDVSLYIRALEDYFCCNIILLTMHANAQLKFGYSKHQKIWYPNEYKKIIILIHNLSITSKTYKYPYELVIPSGADIFYFTHESLFEQVWNYFDNNILKNIAKKEKEEYQILDERGLCIFIGTSTKLKNYIDRPLNLPILNYSISLYNLEPLWFIPKKIFIFDNLCYGAWDDNNIYWLIQPTNEFDDTIKKQNFYYQPIIESKYKQQHIQYINNVYYTTLIKKYVSENNYEFVDKVENYIEKVTNKNYVELTQWYNNEKWKIPIDLKSKFNNLKNNNKIYQALNSEIDNDKIIFFDEESYQAYINNF
jgi:hypothetical protein